MARAAAKGVECSCQRVALIGFMVPPMNDPRAKLTYVDHDTVRVWKTADGSRSSEQLLTVLYRGDAVEVRRQEAGSTEVALGAGRLGWVRGRLKTTAVAPLALAFIDVGQGDACLVTTPNQSRVLIDGGENKLASRYLAARFRDETQAGASIHFEAIVATHGDADHLEGLSILVLDAAKDVREGKRIRVTAARVLHSGVVKRESGVPERERLGTPVDVGGVLHVAVHEDPRSVADANKPFRRWAEAICELERRGSVSVGRLDAGRANTFAFLDDVSIEVLGPRAVVLPGGGAGVPMLKGAEGGGSVAATINGHSAVLRLRYGNVTILLTGDLTGPMQSRLATSGVELRSDVLKVPHHGSDDLDRAFVSKVAPLVSIISAGDEDARRDYLHPRANALAMLGQSRRGAEPVVFVTNLAAFDSYAGEAFYAVKDGEHWKPDLDRGTFYARERTAFGIIHVRTDGDRLLVVRRGARIDRVEAYSYRIAADGSAEPLEVERI